MALARALAVEPKVLLLDEPFGALDARVRTELRSWLRRLHEEVQVTTVLVTHDQEEAMDVADSIVVMNHARIEQAGSPEDLYDHPASEFVMSFIGQVNKIGDIFIRPHDVGILLQPGPSTERAVIDRLVHLGFEVRVELVAESGQAIHAQVTRDEAKALGLSPGQTVYISLLRSKVFDAEETVSCKPSRVSGGTVAQRCYVT